MLSFHHFFKLFLLAISVSNLCCFLPLSQLWPKLISQESEIWDTFSQSSSRDSFISPFPPPFLHTIFSPIPSLQKNSWHMYCTQWAGCEFDCVAEENAPHFRHFATQISVVKQFLQCKIIYQPQPHDEWTENCYTKFSNEFAPWQWVLNFEIICYRVNIKSQYKFQLQEHSDWFTKIKIILCELHVGYFTLHVSVHFCKNGFFPILVNF